ncbi:MAG: NifB/NifX family molybdenum-iron cluster-binding protein [Prolixibacteraceae bacterium]|nr:NifB/NifX family molybdenum-iron cluster-binding protein [Prolixibacteraceae bacterium]
MKTVITAHEGNTQSPFDHRFGRAHWFCIYDNEKDETSFLQNQNIDAQGGAGSKSAELLVEMKVDKVISGHFGPKAKDLLDRFEIQMIEMSDEATVQDIINKLKNN